MRDAARIAGFEPYDPKWVDADVKLAANESPYDTPLAVREAVAKAILSGSWNRYPDPMANELREAIAAHPELLLPTLGDPSSVLGSTSIDPKNIIVGNGGDEILFNAFLAFGGPGAKALSVPPTFSVYELDAKLTDTGFVEVPRLDGYAIDEYRVLETIASDKDINLVLITSPNNPTGDLAGRAFIERLLASTDALVILDEAYAEFSETTALPLLDRYENLCILRTFSKAYTLAGARLGYAISSRHVIDRLSMVRQPYSVDVTAQRIGIAVCDNIDRFRPLIRQIIRDRGELFMKLQSIAGVEAHPSSANFILTHVLNAPTVWEGMANDDKVLVRNLCSQAGLEDCLRITVGTRGENDIVLDALARNIMKGF
ncbi:MAG: histidinol-phosphate transaminase [Coriobacteriales bacterium]|jgi:histidinol-phosphate aminotransferase